MKKQLIKIKCPMCHGTGSIERFGYTEEQRNVARELYAKGKTLRYIGEKIGVNHPQKVKSLMMSNK